jgi:hypothetical protein
MTSTTDMMGTRLVTKKKALNYRSEFHGPRLSTLLMLGANVFDYKISFFPNKHIGQHTSRKLAGTRTRL